MTYSPEEILILSVIIFDMILFSLWLFNIARGIFKIAPLLKSDAPVSATNANLEFINSADLELVNLEENSV
mgnify:FL=1